MLEAITREQAGGGVLGDHVQGARARERAALAVVAQMTRQSQQEGGALVGPAPHLQRAPVEDGVLAGARQPHAPARPAAAAAARAPPRPRHG